MADFLNSTFVGQRILIDGHRFENSRFENCVLVYGGGPLRMVGNDLSGVRWEFVDSAARTVGLLASFYQSGGSSKEFVEILLATFGKAVAAPLPASEGGQSTLPEMGGGQ